MGFKFWSGQSSTEEPLAAIPSVDAEVNVAFVFASPKVDGKSIVEAVKAKHPEAHVLYSSTAGEFTEQSDTSGGVSVALIHGDMKVATTKKSGLAGDPTQMAGAIAAELGTSHDGYPHRTCVLLMDPLQGNCEEIVLALSMMLGPDVLIAGGAAGDDLAMTNATVGDSSGISNDTVVATMLHTKEPLAMGIGNGHKPFTEPLQVTKAENNTVYEIEGRPALDVWAEKTQARSGIDMRALPEDERIGYLLRFEGALALGPDAYKIRAPLAFAKNGGLNFGTAIPQGAKIYISESTVEAQIDAATAAAEHAKKKLAGKNVAGILLFDCVCRKLILGDQFQTAVKRVSDTLNSAPVAGFETYAEIGLDQGELSGFHNTTSVVVAFPS